jgi:LysM repeat protein
VRVGGCQVRANTLIESEFRIQFGTFRQSTFYSAEQERAQIRRRCSGMPKYTYILSSIFAGCKVILNSLVLQLMSDDMAQNQDQLKTKYQNVLNTVQQVQGSLKNVNMEGDKLFIRGEVGTEQQKNQVWDAIKQVDSNYGDLHADIVVNPALAPKTAAAGAGGAGSEQRTYTVQEGDSLSKIAEKFYGNASAYNKIFEANRDKLSDPNKVRAGAQLVIPQ